MNSSKLVLPIIVISQFFCTSLWFAGNGVMQDLIINFNLTKSALGHLTSAVQLGFISGTLVFAILSIADRYSPSKVFLLSALFGALFNLGIILKINNLASILTFRYLTGFFLAGIYPVGMKIAADYYKKGLGKSLGYLVGALVFGTALPHLLKEITTTVSWKYVLILTSCLATIGGVMMVFLIPDGPYRKPSQHLNLRGFFSVFKKHEFRAAAFGYFGHMWELYAFWTFVPIMLVIYKNTHSQFNFNIPFLSFLIIAIGGISCAIAGSLTRSYNTKKLASTILFLSCLCCLMSPFAFLLKSDYLFIFFLLFWGMVVIADSPLFSTLVALNAPSKLKGTALTIVNCIGFSLTIFSIQLINELRLQFESNMIFMILAIGPIFGLIALRNRKQEQTFP